MSMKHLKTEDMIKLIYAQKFDDELLAHAAAVNHHLFECEECQRKYDAILSIKEMVENAGRESVNVFETEDLVLYYDNRLCRENDYVVLLDDMNEVRYAEKVKKFDETQMCATFKNVLPNTYYAVIATHDRNGNMLLNR